jgi:hypothetical protein
MKRFVLRRKLSGFSMVDPLIAATAFAVLMLGVINFWRLAEYKCAKARIDASVSQILRESSDYISYVPYDLLPADGTPVRSGFLLHPRDPGTGSYKDVYSFTVLAAVATTAPGTLGETKEIVLTLTYQTDPQPQSDDPVQETVRTNALIRDKT